MNERTESHCKARFSRKEIAGFSRIVLMSALALAASVPDEAGASDELTGAAGKARSSVQVGKASWYGLEFHGRKTASGELFNPHRLTAAHPRLPLGTRARVTNLNNGTAVVVTINDRGPHGGGRIIDLSRAAARILAMNGTTRVSIETLP